MYSDRHIAAFRLCYLAVISLNGFFSPARRSSPFSNTYPLDFLPLKPVEHALLVNAVKRTKVLHIALFLSNANKIP